MNVLVLDSDQKRLRLNQENLLQAHREAGEMIETIGVSAWCMPTEQAAKEKIKDIMHEVVLALVIMPWDGFWAELVPLIRSLSREKNQGTQILVFSTAVGENWQTRALLNAEASIAVPWDANGKAVANGIKIMLREIATDRVPAKQLP